MNWIGLLIAFALVSSAALAASFLARWQGSAEKPSSAASRFLSCLPGYDCSFCGHGTCREYAEAIDTQAADPVLCAPGGVKTEDAIRALLAKRPRDARSVKRRAVIRCGGTKGVAALAFDYDNREDCVSAAALYGGPKACKNGCLGFGTCVAACP
jgi:electron transport complex protein RnfB